MSYRATNWAYDMKITGPQKPVLVALADMADEAATCFPGQGRIAEMTGLSTATVARAISKLESQGLISRTRRVDQFGHRTSDRYQLHLTVTVTETLDSTAPTKRRAYKAESRSLTSTQSIPNLHSAGGTTREPLENHQSRTTDEESVDNLCARQARNLGVDFWKVRTAIAKACDRTPEPTAVLRIIAGVLDRASEQPKSPTAFVVAAIRNDWPEWQRFIDEAVAS